MNLDLYTEEFRHFKYLKCSAAAIEYFKETAVFVNRIRPESYKDDTTFVWKTRLEFAEQLLDLKDDTVFLVEPGEIQNTKLGFAYEEARIREIDKPVIFNGHPFLPLNCRIVTLEDIPEMENPQSNSAFFLCQQRDFVLFGLGTGSYIAVGDLPVIPRSKYKLTVNCMFFDKEEAHEYQVALTKFLRYNADTVSTISSRL